MNPDQLKSLLAAGPTAGPGRSPTCPDEQHVAGYVDGGLDEGTRQALERHLADCGHCLTVVGLLSRERHAALPAAAPDSTAAQARVPASGGQVRRWQSAPQWAAAAVLVLAVPLLIQLSRSPDVGSEGQGRPASAMTRNVPSSVTELHILSPAAGAAVDARRLSFRWSEVPGTPYYDVRIVTDTGDVVVQERVAGTTWQPPAQLRLQTGAEYFVHVDAYPSGDKPLSSGHLPFRIAE
jgi:hypothetical protein